MLCIIDISHQVSLLYLLLLLKRNFIGIEIRSKLVEEANQLLERANQNRNCRFICANLLSESHRLILEESFKNIVSINRISVLFPDPWIKKKHRYVICDLIMLLLLS
jgi:tRNA G46 methylase TrmB